MKIELASRVPYIINKQTKDTTLVEFSYKGNKIIKDIIKNFHYSR